MVGINLQQFSYTPTGASEPFLGPLDLQVNSGSWLAVLGGNGSGKSTLAQLLCGGLGHLLHGHVAGDSNVLGIVIGEGRLNTHAAQRQLVQQSPQLQLSGCAFSVEQEIAFGPENLGLPVDEIIARVDEALQLTHSHELRLRHPATLSGGEAQRVVIASALAMRPQLLLLDEAFSRMTPSMTQHLLETLKNYSQTTGCIVMLFERTLLPAAHHCEQLLLLEQGKVQARGALQDVLVPSLATINMPDAWQVLGKLIAHGEWQETIPQDERSLVNSFKAHYAATR